MITKSQIIVHILVTFFGIGSWLAINGSFVELPLMVSKLPEGWTLASYIAIMTQLGNIGPLLVSIYNRFARTKLSDSCVVYFIYTTGAIACLLLSYFWDHVTNVTGSPHSIPFFVLVFFQAFVDCMSSVVFLPYMATLKPQYITSLFIGQGLSGVLPGVVGLIQGAGEMSCKNVTNASSNTNSNVITVSSELLTSPLELTEQNTTSMDQFGDSQNWMVIPVYAEPLFGVSDFFIFLTVVTVICGLAFFLLNRLTICKKEHMPQKKPVLKEIPSTEKTPLNCDMKPEKEESLNMADGNVRKDATADTAIDGPGGVTEPLEQVDETDDKRNNKDITEHENRLTPSENPVKDARVCGANSVVAKDKLLRKPVIFAFAVFLIANALTNGILVSVQPYATMSYSLNTYHIITILFKIIPVFATSLAYIKAIKSISLLTLLVALGCSGSVYIITAACFSPSPWLAHELSGAVIMACVWTLTSAVFAYLSVCVASIVRAHGRRALFWCGVMKQVGSASGSLVMFLLVNLTDAFTSSPACAQ